MTITQFIPIVLGVLAFLATAHFLRRRAEKRSSDLKKNLFRAASLDAIYWEQEYHKLFERYEHGQTTIRRLGQENKALQSQAPTPKRRGRPLKES